MAQFNTNVQQVNGTADVPRQHPVVDDSVGNALLDVGQIAGDVGTSFEVGQAKYAKTASVTAAANYAVALGKFQDAVAQGAMSTATARSRIRVLRNQAIANNPAALPQIDAATTAFLSKSGLGSEIASGTPDEQLHEKLVTEAAKAGVPIDLSMPKDEQDRLLSAYQGMKLSEQQLQLAAAKIGVIRGNIGIESDKQGLLNKKQAYVTGSINQQTARNNLYQSAIQRQGTQAILNGAADATTLFLAKLRDIQTKFNTSAKTPADIQTAVDATNAAMAEANMAANKTGLGASSQLISQVVAPMQDAGKALIGYFQGKTEADAVAQNLQTAQAQAALAVIHGASPQAMKVVGTLKMMPQISSALSNKVADSTFLDLIGQNGANPSPTVGRPPVAANLSVGRDSPEQYSSASNYLDSVKTMIQTDATGTLNPTEQAFLHNNMTNIVNGVFQNDNKAKEPQDYNLIMGFLADPQVNAWVVKHPDTMKTSNMSGASDVLNQQYILNIEPLLHQKFVSAIGTITSITPSSNPVELGMGVGNTIHAESVGQVVQAEYTGGGIRFSAVDPKNEQAVAAANGLNSDVAPIISKLVRATATMEGTSNFRKVYEDNYAKLFVTQPTKADNGE